MSNQEKLQPKARLQTLRSKLVAWLRDSAYPLWAEHGVDEQNGGFIETLGQNGTGLPHPRRARVHPRQIYAFAQATGFGWRGDATRIVARGMSFFSNSYLRSDGLFRTLAGVDGAPLDDRALLYDQAFALLGYSAAAVALDARADFERRAIALRNAIDAKLRAGEGAFHSTESADDRIESNPHMHLLEACMAWAEIGEDPAWNDWTRRLVQLAVTKFIRPDSGALGEAFDRQLKPASGVAGRVIEPGHQFEWAWLLMRAESRHPAALSDIALRLITIGEEYGVHNQVAVNSLLDDFSVQDGSARFWPQTERLKAALLAAQMTGKESYWEMAARAAQSMLPYLNTPVPGLWLDVQLATGELVDSPAPASTFYHLVGAISVLDKALETLV
jgi:mannose/cellobiose epimerase-like protein (N-acyl-D-glucosamine 2-epimerase family)